MDATIESRRQKGVWVCSQIIGIVNGLSLGHFYFKISFLYRNTMLVDGILTNAEVWYPISDSQIGILENVDLMLIRKLVNGHSKTGKGGRHLGKPSQIWISPNPLFPPPFPPKFLERIFFST